MRSLSFHDAAPSLFHSKRLAVFFTLVLATGLYGEEEAPKPVSGQTRLASGRTADYTVHFNRNSLQACVRVEDGLIALTTSGTLLRFSLEHATARWVHERIDLVRVTCLGKGEGDDVFAGLSDGRVCRIDPTTLDLTEVAKPSGSPEWIGWLPALKNRPAGLVVVTNPTKSADRNDKHWEKPYWVVNDLATGKKFALEEVGTTVLLDQAGGVWLGADKGEWGGMVTRVDLIEGTVKTLKPPPSRDPDEESDWEGIYGFIELHNGQVWAYGGTSHMGFNSGEITRVDSPQPQRLFAFEPPRDREEKTPPNRPVLPITQMTEVGDGFLVLSYDDVFRVDIALKTWKKVAELDLEYRWGRPNAVGSHPAVAALNPPRHPGEPYWLATVGDGLVAFDGTKATSHALPGQLAASRIDVLANSTEGTLFFTGDDRLPVWRLGAKGWEVVSFAPPFEPDPANEIKDAEAHDGGWSESTILVGPGGRISTVNATGWRPGTRTTSRWDGGKAERIGRETSSLTPDHSFITADGTLWNASFDGLMQFQSERWRLVEKREQGATPTGPVKSLNSHGPPWLLFAGRDKGLWNLVQPEAGAAPRLAPLKVEVDGKPLEVDDAIPAPGADGTALLATRAGLRSYTLSTQTVARVNLPEPPRPATTLVRDGLGRLWSGNGQGLWLTEPGAKAHEVFDRVPWLSQGGVEALAPDPRHADGVIVALGDRGVVFVRAGQKP